MDRYSVVFICLMSLFLLKETKPATAQAPSFLQTETVVTPLSTEDIDGPCHYSISIPTSIQAVRGVWVIFDRGRDVHDLATDREVLTFAAHFNLAILMQSHCPGKLATDRGDMNMNPAEGLGPALLRALDQFGKQTSHPELSASYLLLLGFSGAGPLSARLIEEYPQRVLAGILSAPGHFPPQGINTVTLNKEAQQVPEFIIAGGADDRSGTQLPYAYFEKYRKLGAPWTFVVQNQSPHCCTANAKSLMLHWLAAAITERLPGETGQPLRNITQSASWLGSIRTSPTANKDSFGFYTFNVEEAEVYPARLGKRMETQNASWLPSALVATEWKLFVEQKSHPLLPLR